MLAFGTTGIPTPVGESVVTGFPLAGGRQYTAIETWVPSECSTIVIAIPPQGPLSDLAEGALVLDFVRALLECFPLADKPQAPAEAPRLFPPPPRAPEARPTALRSPASFRCVTLSELPSAVHPAAAAATLASFPPAAHPPVSFLVLDLPLPAAPVSCVAIGYAAPLAPGSRLFLPVPALLAGPRGPQRPSASAAASLTLITACTRRRWVGRDSWQQQQQQQ